MTYTLIARCPLTGAFGIGIATYSLAVGSKCPAIATGCGAISTQAFVNPTFKAHGIRLLDNNHPAQETLKLLQASDADIAYRQVGIIDRWGGVACHTGNETRAWSGHRLGDGFAALGNVLKSGDVVDAMANAFSSGPSDDLAERLQLALEAGRSAGGQHGLDGPLAERSAHLLIHETDEHPFLDLRVDSHPDAVLEMRRLLDEFRPYIPFYQQRWREPAQAVPQDAFVTALSSNKDG